MKFDIYKEMEEIAYLNGIADAHIESGKELNKKARIHVEKAKILFGLD